MICCTRRVSRSLSVSIRPANRLTASGSSLASATASASSLIAPTGVLSSWLTLATKSRRTASTRRSRVRSSTRASTRCEPERRDPGGDVPGRGGRAVHEQLGLADLAVAAYLVDQLVELVGDQLGAADQPEGVRRRGGLHDRVGVVDDHRAAAQHDRTVATSGGTTGSAATGSVDCWRSLMCQASTAPPATTAPRTAARNACVVGSTPSMVGLPSRDVRFSSVRGTERSCSVHVLTPTGHLAYLRWRHA